MAPIFPQISGETDAVSPAREFNGADRVMVFSRLRTAFFGLHRGAITAIQLVIRDYSRNTAFDTVHGAPCYLGVHTTEPIAALGAGVRREDAEGRREGRGNARGEAGAAHKKERHGKTGA